MALLNKTLPLLFWIIIANSCTNRLTNNNVLKGQVIDNATKEGIPNAKIKILLHNKIIDTLTTLEGEFYISNLSKENCKIEISALGYPLSLFPVKIVNDTNQVIFTLKGVKLDSVDVNYEGASIIYRDDSGNVKTVKGNRK